MELYSSGAEAVAGEGAEWIKWFRGHGRGIGTISLGTGHGRPVRLKDAHAYMKWSAFPRRCWNDADFIQIKIYMRSPWIPNYFFYQLILMVS